MVENCLRTGDKGLDSHSDGKGIVPWIDGGVMGGSEPEWGDAREMWGVCDKRGGNGEQADVQLIELTDGLPLLSLGGLNCNELMQVNVNLINTIRDCVQGCSQGVVLLVATW